MARLRDAGARFRNEVVEGVDGRRVIVGYPAGSLTELFQPTVDEARLAA